MNKWYGKVGYVETVEVEPGIWEEQETVRSYYGDLVRNSSKFQTSGGVNDDRDVSVEISIVADPYANLHFRSIRYVEFGGVNWKVNTVEPRRPRLILALGGEYNG